MEASHTFSTVRNHPNLSASTVSTVPVGQTLRTPAFVDGAARSNLVVIGLGGTERPEPPPYGPGNLLLIDNGRLEHPPAALRRALGDVAATTVSVMMDQSMQTAPTRSCFGAQFLGYNFKMVAIPHEVEIGQTRLLSTPSRCTQRMTPVT